MSKNLIRKTYRANANFVAPAGVKSIRVLAVRKVVANLSVAGAIDKDGVMWGWGVNDVGNGSPGLIGDNTATNKSSPVLVAGGRKWLQVMKHQNHAIGLDDEGNAYGWGVNSEGNIGDNSTANRSSPTLVVGGLKFRQISTADLGINTFTVHGITTSGDLYAWGDNQFGQIADNTLADRSSPTLVVGGRKWKRVFGGPYAFGIDENDDLFSWGRNNNGQLGHNDTVDRSSPTLIPGGLKWKHVAAGSGTTLAITTAGVMYAWGNNSNGRVGDNTTIARSTPVLVAGGRIWKTVQASGAAVAIDENGDAYGWAQDAVNGVGTNRSSPTLVPTAAGVKWVNVFASGSNSVFQDRNGNIYTVGDNSTGDGGDNTTTNQITSPVTITVGGKVWKTADKEVLNSTVIPVIPGQTYPVTIFSNMMSVGGFPIAAGIGLTEIVIEYSA